MDARIGLLALVLRVPETVVLAAASGEKDAQRRLCSDPLSSQTC
jgi:hypothetical protein